MTTRHIDVNFRVRCLVRNDTESQAFVAYCPALDVYSAGKTRPEARVALAGALKMYIQICHERQLLGQILHKRGFSASVETGVKGPSVPSSDVEFIAVTETMLAENPTFDDAFDLEVPMPLWQSDSSYASERQACLQ